MIWLLRDFDLLSVLLHAAILSFEAVLLGGVAFWLLPARRVLLSHSAMLGHRRMMQISACGLAAAEAATIAITSATMLAGSSLTFRDILNASFLRAEAATILLALALGGCARFYPRQRTRVADAAMLLLALGTLVSIVFLSHALSQMDHRLLLAVLTALHHLGTAAWIGAMPYLLFALARSEDATQGELLVRRYSAMALTSVLVLVAAGIGMTYFYVGSIQGLYGTSYGLLVLTKIYLLLCMLALGAGNWYLLRSSKALPLPLLLRLRRFSEVELGLGFVVLLAAASLTAQSPASEMQSSDMVSLHAYRQQMAPVWPRLHSPAFTALKPPTSLRQGVEEHQFGAGSNNDAADNAWSEYNHHWAGLIVLVAGALALLSRWRKARWARYWPLCFGGLALFIVLRADPEAWPLGPRPFWASFSYPDVLQHRLAAVLILGFAAFEAAVQAGRLKKQWPAFIFPLVCAAGAALLLTHSHGLDNMTSEVLAEASHTAIAILGATVAGARWLELRLPASRQQRMAGCVWPVALMLAGLVLINYREA